MVTEAVVAAGTLVAAEPAMALVHRFLFHGPLWCEHRSHHTHPTARRIVRNDLLWSGPLLVSAALVAFGSPGLTGVGIGVVAYVAAYVFVHDGVAYGRFPVPRAVRRLTVFRVVARTHRLHHRGEAGASPFAVYAASLEYRWRLTARYTPPTKTCAAASHGPGGRGAERRVPSQAT